MALNPADLRLYLITDQQLCAARGLVETVRQAVAGGVTMVQLRDKQATTAERITLAQALLAELQGVPLIVNDDIEAAIASGAHGAHIGQGDGEVARARARLGPDRILGLSCETRAHVQAANALPVDYLGLGPVFATLTKPDHEPPIRFAGLAQLVAASRHPNVAIGGLNATHVDPVLAAGADGLAIVSAICGQPDPQAAAAHFFPTNGASR